MYKKINKFEKINKYMNFKKISLILFLLITISSVFASQDSLGIFRQNDEARLIQVCSDATYINISSITLPNSTASRTNIEMSYSGSGEYFYIFNDTSQLGPYRVQGISDGCDKTYSYKFLITKTGTVPTLSQMLLVISIILVILMFLVGGIYGMSSTYEKTWFVFYISISYVALFVLSYLMWYLTDFYFAEFIALNGILYMLWLVLAYGFFPFEAFISLWLLVSMMNEMDVKRKMKMGYTKDEAVALFRKNTHK